MTINWRQLYYESQVIRSEDTCVSTERICRLVNIYKNDLIEQDLQQHAQRVSMFARCCQTCAPKSFTIYKWLDTHISGDKDLFDFHLSGRSVCPLVYYWNKHLASKPHVNDMRGEQSDFYRKGDDPLSIASLCDIDEHIIVREHQWKSLIPQFIRRLITRFQMYYTYRTSKSLCSSIQIHTQPMKSLRLLCKTNIAPIFVCFVNDNNDVRQLFWTFRHLITVFNWPSTMKIFSNCAFENVSFFERTMANWLGFVDLSSATMRHANTFRYLYRCLKTSHQNGPIVLLLDQSHHDHLLLCFLFDLIRFDLSVPDMIVIPTSLNRSYLSFSQPFALKELLEFYIRKLHLFDQGYFCGSINDDRVHELINSIFLHLVYDSNQLVPKNIDYPHIIAAIVLSQMPVDPTPTVETIADILQTIIKTCPFILTDNNNHPSDQMTSQQIEQYYSKIPLLLDGMASIRKRYFLEILAALSILLKVKHTDDVCHLLESDMFDRMNFLLFTFGNHQHLIARPCQNANQLIQQTIQHCQYRNYFLIDDVPQRSMTFRDTIPSDHEWSDEEDGLNDRFDDDEEEEEDEEMMISNVNGPKKVSEPLKTFYRINFRENQYQLIFFAKLFGPYIEAIIFLLKSLIENPSKQFSLASINAYAFNETPLLLSDQHSHLIFSFVRRALAYRSHEMSKLLDETPLFFESTIDNLHSCSTESLLSLHDDFAQFMVHLTSSM